MEGTAFQRTVVIDDRAATNWSGSTVDYGDGSGGQSLTVDAAGVFVLDHVFGDNGSYTVTVTIADDIGQSLTQTVDVVVSNQAPAPAIDSISATRVEGTAISFSGSATDPAGTNDSLSYAWDFGDGNSATGAAADHAYADNGTYTVTLTVSDEDGGSTTVEQQITVDNVKPTPVIDSISATRVEGTSISFAGSATDPAGTNDTLSYVWNFGDGNSATGVAAAHAYADNGTYTVALTVSDEDGGSTTVEQQVTVDNVKPTPVIDSISATRVEGTSISFAGSATDPAGANDTLSYVWNFGDGNTASGTSFTHTYADSGTYTVTLTVSDEDGGSTAVEQQITVDNVAPTGTISGPDTILPGIVATVTIANGADVSPIDIATGLRYAFALSPAGLAATWADAGTAASADFTFTAIGPVTVYGRVIDKDGDATDSSLTIIVEDPVPELDPLVLSTGPYVEGGVATLSGTFVDQSTTDAHVVVIAWGDGSPDSELHLNNGVRSFATDHVFADNAEYTITVTVTDSELNTDTATCSLTVINVKPVLNDASFTLKENSATGTVLATLTAVDPGNDVLSYAITGGAGAGLFVIDPATGVITVAPSAVLDFETTPSLSLDVTVTDDDGATDAASLLIDLTNQASIAGVVYVDVDQDGQFDANEIGLDNVTIELLDEAGDVLFSTLTSDGGLYFFEDLDAGTYRIRETQATGVDDGSEQLGDLGGTVVANDVMELILTDIDAASYNFAEFGEQLSSGDTAGIGFWQNKHGQALITSGGSALANWLSTTFGNIFGNHFEGADGVTVAEFYRDQLFRQKGTKVAGPAKVDAQFMAVAFAAYFTSSDLAGNVGANYGFNVTAQGVGAKVVNTGASGLAFGVADNTDLTIMQILLATNSMTDEPDDILGFAHIYDRNGDGVIDDDEKLLRTLANDLFDRINGFED